MASEEDANKVEEQGEATETTTFASFISSFIVNLLIAGSMTEVWAMINGLQIIVYMPLFKLKSPGNVNTFIEYLQELTKFEVVDIPTLVDGYMYFPEMDSITINF